MSRVLITGSRDWEDEESIRDQLAHVDHASDDGTVLVSGACPTGADAIAERLALDLGWAVERWPADWEKYGKRAGYLRNKHMVDLGADVCLAFIRNGSRGASMTAHLAEEAGIPTIRIEVDE